METAAVVAARVEEGAAARVVRAAAARAAAATEGPKVSCGSGGAKGDQAGPLPQSRRLLAAEREEIEITIAVTL